MTARGFAEGYVEAGGFRIRYLEAGAGTPVVYLHGGGGLHLSRAHELLAERFRVVALEAPGFGRSPENTSTGSIRELAATLGDAVDALAVGEHVLYGTSLGAVAALWLAVDRPARIRSLVLEAPAAIRPPDWRPPRDPAALRRALYARQELAPPPEPPDVVAKQLALGVGLTGPPRDPELEQALRGLSTPTLVVWGKRDGLYPPDLAHEYPRLLQNCCVALVDDAAHEVNWDCPETVAELVADFVEREAPRNHSPDP